MNRATGGVVVASLALVGAALVPAATAVATAATPAPAARSAAGAAVALQVKYPDGSVRTWCVAYRSGMTGADVLKVATPTYGTGPYAGFVLKIGGKGTTPPTTTKYWAYWRSTTGKAADYTYSASGVGSTKPAAKSVEAWVWNSGSTTTFPRHNYATLCPNGATTSS